MENVNQPAPVTPAELLTRQLTDWELLHQELSNKPIVIAQDVNYCKAQIERIESELSKLNQL